MYNGWGDNHYTHILTQDDLSGVDLHYDVGDVLTPIFSENETHSSYLFSQRAIEIIRDHNPEQVCTIFTNTHNLNIILLPPAFQRNGEGNVLTMCLSVHTGVPSSSPMGDPHLWMGAGGTLVRPGQGYSFVQDWIGVFSPPPPAKDWIWVSHPLGINSKG